MLNYKLFHLSNSIDTCAVWNLVSSSRLSVVAFCCGLDGYLTHFVFYECMRSWKCNKEHEAELKKRLNSLFDGKKLKKFSISLDDLADNSVVQLAQRMDLGELSALIFAKKYGIAFLTDDQKARKLASIVLSSSYVQTTPHLFGWLFYMNKLSDEDKAEIIKEHSNLGGSLSPLFEHAYLTALQLRLIAPEKE